MRIQLPEIILSATGIMNLLAALFTKTLFLIVEAKDTKYQISMIYIFLALGLFFLCFGIMYHLTQNKLYSKWLSWIHISITMVLSVLIATGSERITPGEPRYLDLSNWTTFEKSHVTITVFHLIILFCVVQLLFIINLLLGMVRKATTNMSLPL